MAAVHGSSSTSELTSDVNSAVEHLRELGDRMREGHYGFSAADIGIIDTVIAALRELDSKRLKAHELLEAETINASVLRHRLATFPDKLKRELAAALASAKKSNAAQIQDLQAQLSHISAQTSQSENRRKVLELHSDALESELRQLEANHDTLVKKVNALMLKKAEMQISLNDTKDKLQKASDKIASLEAGMQQLQHDLGREREDFAAQREALLKQLEESRSKHKAQLEENIQLSRELETLQDDAVKAKLEMDEKQKALQEARESIRRMLAKEVELKESLKDGGRRTLELEAISVGLMKETERMREDFSSKRVEVETKTLQYRKEGELAAAEHERLAGIKRGLRRDLKKAQDARDMQSLSLKDIQESVGTSKHTLLFQAEEGARLAAENRELEFRLAQLLETHKVTVQLCKEERAELTEKLAKEKGTRQEVEESCNELQCQIESLQSAHARAVASLTSQAEQARQQHQSMSTRTTELEQLLQSEEQAIADLSRELASAKAKLQTMTSSLGARVNALEQNIAELSEDLCDRSETLTVLEPACKSLEQEYDERSREYESRKKEIIVLKNKRSSLEDTIQRLQRDLDKMHLPQDKLRMDTLRCRAYTRQCLKAQGKEVKEIESTVLDSHQQLLAVTNENGRIEQACQHLEEEIIRLQALFDSSGEIEARLDGELRMCRGRLVEQWKDNETMEEACSSRDKVVLVDITSLREASEQRLELISGIHGQFDCEIQAFSGFLKAAAGPRNPSQGTRTECCSQLPS